MSTKQPTTEGFLRQVKKRLVEMEVSMRHVFEAFPIQKSRPIKRKALRTALMDLNSARNNLAVLLTLGPVSRLAPWPSKLKRVKRYIVGEDPNETGTRATGWFVMDLLDPDDGLVNQNAKTYRSEKIVQKMVDKLNRADKGQYVLLSNGYVRRASE